MNKILKSFALGTGAVAIMCAVDVLPGSFNLGFIREAQAGVFIAPVRHAAVAAAVVTETAVVASTTANANAAAEANAKAAAAAAKPPPPAAPAGPPPPGTIVTTLPPGCAPTKLNGIDYERCGSTYYKTSMMGQNLVFVVAQP